MSFYKTQIRSINNGVAVDVEGKRLNFAGNYHCQSGDTVWTDGAIIFGNTSVKSAPLIFEEKSGIPVLGTNQYAGENLRGYFNQSGAFKNYNIVKSEGIVNDKKKFQHIETKAILDAEISNDGQLLLAAKGYIEDGIFYATAAGNKDYYSFSEKINFLAYEEFTDSNAEGCTIFITKDGQVIDSLDMSKIIFPSVYIPLDLEAVNKIREGAHDLLEDMMYFKYHGGNFIQDDEEATRAYLEYYLGRVYILDGYYTDASVTAIKIKRNGNWTAIIDATIERYMEGTFANEGGLIGHRPVWTLRTRYTSNFVNRTFVYNSNSGISLLAHDSFFPVQDDFSVKITSPNNQLFKENKKICDLPSISPYRLSAVQIGTKYLVGERNGNLYLIDEDGNIQTKNTTLKNFRLRYMKNISKARK